MRIYHSHAMPTYDTQQELREQDLILKSIPESKIVDPGSYKTNPEKRNSKDPMQFCLSLVKKCESLVFSKFAGKITAGVGKEVNYALSLGLSVYEIIDNRLQKITKPVECLSVFETINLPGYYRN